MYCTVVCGCHLGVLFLYSVDVTRHSAVTVAGMDSVLPNTKPYIPLMGKVGQQQSL